MDIILSLVKIVGSVGLFLYGMQILSEGLQKSASGGLRKTLGMMTENRLLSVITGFIVTVVIQSSSATTVMVISFVNAGLMNLVSAIGVILGANIGTTVTGWIVALLGFSMDITILSLFSIAIALPFMFSKRIKRREVSEIFLGFGLLFIGLEFIQVSMPNISQHPEILSFLSRFEDGSVFSILICVLIGTLVTIVVQSSSATMAITITMAYQGWIGVWTASALCLGQNIGTTVTAMLASLGASTNSKRAALAHTLFNVLGSVLVLILMKPMLSLVNTFTPGNIFAMGKEELQIALPSFLAAFHTLFNLFNTIVFFPFVRPFASLIEHLIPQKEKEGEQDSYCFEYIGGNRNDAPEFYLFALKEEVGKMGSLLLYMFRSWSSLSASNSLEKVSQMVPELKRQEERADQMQEKLTSFSVKMLQNSQSPTNADELHKIIRVIDELESGTDSVFNLSMLTKDRISRGVVFSQDEGREIRGYRELTEEFLTFVVENLETEEDGFLAKAKAYEDRMDSERARLSKEVQERLGKNSGDYRTQLLILEVEKNLEHIGDYLLNIAETLCGEKESDEREEKVLLV